MIEAASQGAADGTDNRPAVFEAGLALFELHEDLVGPAGAELVGPAGQQVHVHQGDRDAQLASGPADGGRHEATRPDDDGMATGGHELLSLLIALAKCRDEAEEFHGVKGQAGCRQNRALERDLLEDALIDAAGAVKEMNPGVRLAGLDLLRNGQ